MLPSYQYHPIASAAAMITAETGLFHAFSLFSSMRCEADHPGYGGSARCRALRRSRASGRGRPRRSTPADGRIVAKALPLHERFSLETPSQGRFRAGRTYASSPFTSGTASTTRQPFSAPLVQV